MKNKITTSSKNGGTKDGINFDYDYNTEYGDGDIPDIDKNSTRNSKGNSSTKNVSPDEVPRRDGPGGE